VVLVSVPVAQEAVVLDAEVIGVHPEFPHDAVLQLVEPCPFCGERHTHHDDKYVAVGTLLHRSAHCMSDRPRRRRRRGEPLRPAPPDSYFLKVAANRFIE
jgi:hypothetical protein